MYAAAQPFASTGAGYLTGIGTPVVALLVAAMWKAWAGRLAKQDLSIARLVESNTESNTALAILLAVATSLLTTRRAHKSLGGTTGDVLGATIELSFPVALLTLALTT